MMLFKYDKEVLGTQQPVTFVGLRELMGNPSGADFVETKLTGEMMSYCVF